MDQATASNWYFRAAGVVTQASWAVTDPTRFHTENALAKTTRGEGLSEAEAAALAAFKVAPDLQLLELNSADAKLAFVAVGRRDILETLDRFATELAGTFGAIGEIGAWQVLEDYCGRALGVTMEESGIGSEDASAHRLARTETPERVAEIQAEWNRQKAEAEAWEASPEGQAEAGAREAAMAPDDGPEGWSQEPPRNPAHPMKPPVAS